MPGLSTLRIVAPAGLLALTLALVACNPKATDSAPVIGRAYAGPAKLSLHRDIDSKSATVATVPHGEKLDIIGQRRRWYRVRTEKGIEGWTSDRELLDTAQMERLKALAAQTAEAPSQGVATTFNALNVHTEPSRASPSFVQVKANEKVDVIAHRVAERGAPAPKRELIPPRPKAEKKSKGKDAEAKRGEIPPPPAPPPPPPPPLPELPPAPAPLSEAEDNRPKVPLDDFSLIRMANGQSGWVLTNGLYLAIPDEVAQYAEGHRITSYFSIGKTDDHGLVKDIWLWTTSESLGEDHDFDGYRVFVWSARHHHYETAYIQRRERGFFPVIAKTGQFSVCLEKPDGSRARKEYVLAGVSVRARGETPCDKPVEKADTPQALVSDEKAGETQTKPSAPRRFLDRVKGLFRK